MTEHFKVAIIGAGPGGLGAATNAAFHGISHILFERKEIGNTVFDYQLRKHVMAEPAKLPLRAKVGFEAGTREDNLAVWNDAVTEHGVNVRHGEVSEISKGSDGLFTVVYDGEDKITADKVVLSIGMQGSPRQLDVPGDDQEHVSYTLKDPDEFKDMEIFVIGAGDAAIENALGLFENNHVSLINLRDEFPRAKDANAAQIISAINSGKIRGFYNTSVNRINESTIVLNTPDGEEEFACDRVIARIGAIMPRKFLEGCGIQFPSDDINSVPIVSSSYESNVEGLHVIGALIGYPLIKQCINQGYEVIEHILGNPVEPADQVLVDETLSILKGDSDTNLNRIRETVPLFQYLSEPQLRETIIDSEIDTFDDGEVVFYIDDYTDSFFSIIDGQVEIELPHGGNVTLDKGEYFGEMGLLSGRRRSATVRAKGGGTVLLETPRKQILKLISSVEEVRREVDLQFMKNALQTSIFPEVEYSYISKLVNNCEQQSFKKGDLIFKEGDLGEQLYVIRKGSVKVSRAGARGDDIAQTYISAGNFVGEMALFYEGENKRTATVSAAVPCEMVVIDKKVFTDILRQYPEAKSRIEEMVVSREVENITTDLLATEGALLDFVVGAGVTDAENVLVIDSDLCIACDNCEAACAATHGGYSRLDRKGGKSFASIQIPISCRHCENPLCMIDCPPDALVRNPSGEVTIKNSCIGCGNCIRNCPYGVIQMVYDQPKEGGFSLFNLLFGSKDSRGDRGVGKAGKCDMCKDLSGGPACVHACPTGAAIRTNPGGLLNIISGKE